MKTLILFMTITLFLSCNKVEKIKTTTVNIGSFDMKNEISKTIDLNEIDFEKVVSVQVIINDDLSDNNKFDLLTDGAWSLNSKSITISRENNDVFNNESFSSKSINRGLIVINSRK